MPVVGPGRKAACEKASRPHLSAGSRGVSAAAGRRSVGTTRSMYCSTCRHFLLARGGCEGGQGCSQGRRHTRQPCGCCSSRRHTMPFSVRRRKPQQPHETEWHCMHGRGPCSVVAVRIKLHGRCGGAAFAGGLLSGEVRRGWLSIARPSKADNSAGGACGCALTSAAAALAAPAGPPAARARRPPAAPAAPAGGRAPCSCSGTGQPACEGYQAGHRGARAHAAGAGAARPR